MIHEVIKHQIERNVDGELAYTHTTVGHFELSNVEFQGAVVFNREIREKNTTEEGVPMLFFEISPIEIQSATNLSKLLQHYKNDDV